MSNSFNSQIEKSLKNPVLQAALDANAARRISVRSAALESLADFEGMRQQAHSVRAEVIAHLDELLERFAARVQENGITVHRAADAQEAQAIILEIARQNDVRRVAKAKSMVSEEIHLNAALEKAGLQVVETDLGEYIIQLRGEAPAHIITPAVHLRRQEVGQTFADHLDMPYTEDVQALTAAARRQLRQVFLEADMGISGVNFGVVETGSLCMITNEGNGRMTTTLPRVHVALMGIERLAPSMDDLVLFLSLLPRSATGQNLTVYTSLINRPRLPGEVDGALQRHLVLLDNGRRRIAASALAEILYCIRCGACLNACPVFRELGGHAYVGTSGKGSAYPGPIGSVLSPALFSTAEFGHLARASSLCGACKEACPVDIDLPKLLLRVRAGKTGVTQGDDRQPVRPAPGNAPGYLRHGLRLFSWIATRPRWFGRAIRWAGAASRLVSPRSRWMKLPAFTGWGYSKDFPRPAVQPFRDRWKNRQAWSGSGRSAAISELREAAPEAASPPVRAEHVDLVSLFKTELEKLGGQFHLTTAESLPVKVAEILRNYQEDCVLSWTEENLPEGLLSRLQESGVRAEHTPNPAMRVGLTGALAGAAETGSILLASGVGRPLTASLLPEVHLAVIKASQIKPSLSEALPQSFEGQSNLVVISGPSRTADIEMTLTIGVHGPKELVVFCLKDEG
jgi:L-lactate dehydrogenase complex protein LldF